jgi:O-antigen ligase
LRRNALALARTPGGDRPLFAALCLLLALAPWPLGSNRAWAICALVVAIALLLVLSWAQAMAAGASPLARLRPAAWPLCALGLFALLVLVQRLGGLAGERRGLVGTVDPWQTLHYLFMALSAAGLFACVLLLVRQPARRSWLALVIVGTGVLQALVAIGLLAVGAEYRFMYQDIRHQGQAIGSFVHRNHLAGYLVLCLSLGIGLLVGALREPVAGPRRPRERLAALLALVLDPRMALRLLLVVMVVALVLTRSRMGNGAFFIALAVLAGLVMVLMPQRRLKAGLLVASLVVVDLVIVGQWVGLERVLQRIDATALSAAAAATDPDSEETLQARLEPARHTLPMLAERPLTGHGGGSYYTAFAPHKSPRMLLHEAHFDHAHNDYAEIAADTGLLGLALLATVVLATLRRAWAQLRDRRTAPGARGAAWGALMASCAVLLHSAVDFNLHIPAYALTYVAILAMVWAPAEAGP